MLWYWMFEKVVLGFDKHFLTKRNQIVKISVTGKMEKWLLCVLKHDRIQTSSIFSRELECKWEIHTHGTLCPEDRRTFSFTVNNNLPRRYCMTKILYHVHVSFTKNNFLFHCKTLKFDVRPLEVHLTTCDTFHNFSPVRWLKSSKQIPNLNYNVSSLWEL